MRTQAFTLIELLVACHPKLRPAERRTIRSGFTLIELLVVIAIIALLAALLTPAMKQALEAGRSSLCRSNLHQSVLAARLYANDHGGAFPSSDQGNQVAMPADKFLPYLGNNKEVLRCPSDVYDTRRHVYTVGGALGRAGLISYQYNGYLADKSGWWNPRDLVPLDMAEVVRPAQVVLMYDGYSSEDSIFLTAYFAPNAMYPRHHQGERVNIGFVDGHVAAFNREINGWWRTVGSPYFISHLPDYDGADEWTF